MDRGLKKEGKIYDSACLMYISENSEHVYSFSLVEFGIYSSYVSGGFAAFQSCL